MTHAPRRAPATLSAARCQAIMKSPLAIFATSGRVQQAFASIAVDEGGNVEFGRVVEVVCGLVESQCINKDCLRRSFGSFVKAELTDEEQLTLCLSVLESELTEDQIRDNRILNPLYAGFLFCAGVFLLNVGARGMAPDCKWAG